MKNVKTMADNQGKFLGNTVKKDETVVFLELIHPLKKYLYNFIQKSLNFSHDSDDLYQETLLRAFKYFRSFNKGKSFKNWLFSIAHNRIKDYYRKLDRVESFDQEIINFQERGLIEDKVQYIYQLVSEMKPRTREVFFLYYYNDFSLSEIAAITGLSRANIKFILYQARKKIKVLLGNESMEI